LSMALVGEIVPKERTGRAMGLIGTMSAVGTALGPSLGGLLIAASGWRAIFLVTVPFGLLAFVLVLRTLPRDHSQPKQARAAFESIGTLGRALPLGSYALAMTLGHGHFGLLNIALLLAAMIGAGLFASIETRAASPLIRLEMLREARLRASLAT